MKTQNLWERARDLFDLAAAAPPAERAALLDRECNEDSGLRAEVESLLRHLVTPGDPFLESPGMKLRPPPTNVDIAGLVGNGMTAWANALVGRKIGRYMVVRLLATGGMGGVFEAMQEYPARAVALKIMPPGLSVPSALARFRMEPEVLARLQHP